jgi:ribosomal protein L40E
VSERWICNRCFTSAEESATVCPNCGLGRGLPAAPEASETVPPPPDESPAAEPVTASSVDSAVEPVVDGPPANAPVADASASVDPAGTDRWVCLRCFASNDGMATACATCGLPRGESPEPSADGSWVAPAAAPPSRGSRIPWRWLLYGVIALAVIGTSTFFAARRGDTGEVTDAGDMSVFDLQVGDCFDVETDATEVESVRAIPCDEPHTYEMFWSGSYGGDVQPSEGEYMTWLEDSCLAEFESYVGLAYADSIYYMGSLSPTEESWSNGDRSYSCYLYNASETPMSGSARGTAE